MVLHLRKKRCKKLPRIDILNLLATYTGHSNWNNFIHLEKARTNTLIKQDIDKRQNKK